MGWRNEESCCCIDSLDWTTELSGSVSYIGLTCTNRHTYYPAQHRRFSQRNNRRAYPISNRTEAISFDAAARKAGQGAWCKNDLTK